VLSPSTEAFDRGDKFVRYRHLESLTDYVLVASERMQIEHYVRQEDESWNLKEYHQPGDRLPLASIGCELPLAEIYERVSFPELGLGRILT
jgi:Uma2 family endonuclease